MRTLKFIVEGQIIKLDPTCDFNDIVPGTEGYLQAKFDFSSEWDGCAKVAAFWRNGTVECPPQALQDGRTCIIPAEALKNRAFTVHVIGKRGDMKIATNKVRVIQNGGTK